MFIPGETVRHQFIIPFAYDEIDHVVISYRQKDNIILEKTITSDFDELTGDTTSIAYDLSQQESLLFTDDNSFTIQLNVYTINGSRHASREMKSSSGIQYYRNVMKGAASNGE